MLKKLEAENIIKILHNSINRALSIKVSNFPKPYYCSFNLKDKDIFSTWSIAGSTQKIIDKKQRRAFLDLRVGSSNYDQITSGGLEDNDDETSSYDYTTLPIDDKNFNGLKVLLWKLTESKFREALTDYSEKKSDSLSKVNQFEKLNSLLKSKKIINKNFKKNSKKKTDQKTWINFCKKASLWVSQLEFVTSSWVEVEVVQETKVFVDSNKSEIVEHNNIYTINGSICNLTKQGRQIDQEINLNFSNESELPSFKEFKEIVNKKYLQLLSLIKAPKLYSYSGPALLLEKPAGLLFHEAIGHRLEGSRLLSTGEGQTFKNKINEKIINIGIDITDTPNLKNFNQTSCIGAFDYDDQGVKSKDVTLVKNGVLKDFLNTRSELPIKNNKLNGHARNETFERPVSRMGVTVVKTKDGLSFKELKNLLVKEIIKQKRKFGIIIYETSGGETETDSFNFQAFSGEISYASRVFADGSEEIIKGLDFVGTPLTALSSILAAGDKQVIDNHYCVAESGLIPVTTISPSILLSNLELQEKDEDLVTQYLLKSPI